MEAADRSPDTPCVLRFERLKEISGDDLEFEREVLGDFLESAPEQMARARRALTAADGRELEQAAHGLKGSSRTLGAELLGNALQELEAAGKSGELGAAQVRFELAERELARVRELLEEYLRKRAA